VLPVVQGILVGNYQVLQCPELDRFRFGTGAIENNPQHREFFMWNSFVTRNTRALADRFILALRVYPSSNW
jgi:hypothetical protein